MGVAGRLTNQVVVSRRRTTRARPALRRVHPWPDHQEAQGSQLDVPSRFLTPIFEMSVLPRMTLGRAAGEVTVATVIDADNTEPSVLDMPLAQLGWRDPFRWLALGWADFSRAPLIGIFYGACFVTMGWLLVACFQSAPEYTMALSAGFLLMGPFLCLGLYDVSRRLGQGLTPSLSSSLTAWRASSAQIGIFAGVLLVLEMLWGRAALIVFAVSFEGMPDFSGPIGSLLTGDNLAFIVTYMGVGAIFAGLIYAISVISIPMIMDKSVDAISAGLTSLRLVTTQTGVMLLWGLLITTLIALAMLPGFFGLLVAGPVLGHASWHAYRAAILPKR